MHEVHSSTDGDRRDWKGNQMKNVLGFQCLGRFDTELNEGWEYKFDIIRKIVKWDVGPEAEVYIVGGVASCLIADQLGLKEGPIASKDRPSIDIDCIVYTDSEHPAIENSTGIDNMSRMFNLDAKNNLLSQVRENIIYGIDSSIAECSVNLNTMEMYAAPGFLKTITTGILYPPAWHGTIGIEEVYVDYSENIWRPLFRIAYRGCSISPELVEFLNDLLSWHMEFRRKWVYEVIAGTARQFAEKGKVEEIVFNEENHFSQTWKEFMNYCKPFILDTASPIKEYRATDAIIRIYAGNEGPIGVRGKKYTPMGEF